MTSKLTRERLEQLADNNTICKVSWDERIELAQIALAAMDSEPDRNPVLAYADSYRDMAKQGVESVPIWSVITDLERNIAPLYRHAQPATASEPLAVTDDELNAALQLHRLKVDGHSQLSDAFRAGFRYARRTTPQPAPVAPVCTCPSGDGSLRWPCPVHTGNSPAQSDCCPEQNHVSPEQNGDTPAQSQGWIPVSERMPGPGILVLVYTPPQPGDYPGDVRIGFDYIDPDGDDPTYWFNHGENYEHFCCVACDGMTGPSEKALYTHWMPLPAAPQEVKGE
ncbi:DUF551 domain-containing protein [Klebsiella quasipneumoniae]|uniref:DUF551 domain-containing protein n=1 Tax=Klebsiella quasipneumoniae TaxID=1463165 RepID=UPI00164A5B74|nr:DUF551 domain-containing protein [Klebsiella quasipneumoniae]HDO7218438.1 DUF551 domain-containing protein [Klebsiella pneumoniae]HDT5203342.1 DUF551 domain-containing protein [Klebsiella quasipneumoniae subsp. similipneumoniae]MBC4639647.1 DUF551 domain-containing protein [Klebsiella quasipneumoniae]MBC4691269.1 DUF551 domain-containing protein [Klebsiella quasipneumoniae]MBC4718486.1 DUF551 domain-containing protein [Klebsiella quasipneumoniae]